MSTPINEAYARIDVATILDLQNRINSLEKVMPTEAISKIRDNNYNIKKTRIFAKAVNLGNSDGNTIKVNFGTNLFSERPVVTATLYDPLTAGGNIEQATLTMRDLSNTSVKIDINRKTKGRVIVHVIAIGIDDR